MVTNKSRVSKYYAVLNHYNNFRNVKSKMVCKICFQTECNHRTDKIKRKEGLESLTYWVEIFKMQAQQDMDWLTDDIIVPKFPTQGSYDSSVRYDVLPRLNVPLSVVHITDKPNVFTDGQPSYVDLPRLTIKATHYGYILDDQFYVLKSFKNGFFYNAHKIKKVVDIPDNSLVTGFYYLPYGNVDYDDFSAVACKT